MSNNVLTEALEHLTNVAPTTTRELNLPEWAKWLRLTTHNDPQIESMVQSCAAFATAFRDYRAPRWITLLGNSGTGKSHCGRRLWKHIAARVDWRRASFVQEEIYWPGFVSELRSGDAYKRLRDMQRWPVLFLDDICAERDTSGFAAEQLNTLLGCRADEWTILTSNLSLGQLGNIDPRMADRAIRSPNILVEVNTTSHALR